MFRVSQCSSQSQSEDSSFLLQMFFVVFLGKPHVAQKLGIDLYNNFTIQHLTSHHYNKISLSLSLF